MALILSSLVAVEWRYDNFFLHCEVGSFLLFLCATMFNAYLNI